MKKKKAINLVLQPIIKTFGVKITTKKKSERDQDDQYKKRPK